MSKVSRSLVAVHRHGHRSPSLQIYPPSSHQQLLDQQAWIELLPLPNKVDELAGRHPVSLHEEAQIPSDLKTFPYGCLTQRGLDCLQVKGREFGKFFNLTKSVDIRVFSTHYQRTQLSAQAFLNGIISNIQSETMGTVDRMFPIVVRHPRQCSLNFFDSNPQASYKLLNEIQNESAFQAMESQPEVMEMKIKLIELFPALAKKGFDYLRIADYFMCRQAHDLDILTEAVPYGERLQRHLSRRFHRYFSHKRFLPHAAVPILIDVLSSLLDTDDSSGQAVTSDALTVFSGHDTTIFALLHSLGAEWDDGSGAGLEVFWPPYGCTVAFELTKKPGVAVEHQEILVYLDNRPLRLSKVRGNCLTVKDFQTLIEECRKNS